jgi:ADP-ribose pyrophosphatase YjhB (NUDIX family)
MKTLKKSAGLLIIQNNKILLAHPTNAPWYGTYTIPKGKQEKGETLIETAIRETYEEIGIKIPIDMISKKFSVIPYFDKNGFKYKELYYFPVYLDDDMYIGDMILQKKEIDWADFLDLDEAEARIFWRFEEMLSYIK